MHFSFRCRSGSVGVWKILLINCSCVTPSLHPDQRLGRLAFRQTPVHSPRSCGAAADLCSHGSAVSLSSRARRHGQRKRHNSYFNGKDSSDLRKVCSNDTSHIRFTLYVKHGNLQTPPGDVSRLHNNYPSSHFHPFPSFHPHSPSGDQQPLHFFSSYARLSGC